MSKPASIVAQRQAPLRDLYARDPDRAQITKKASTVSTTGDALHGTVIPGQGYDVRWNYGIDRAIGGLHDAPNPGEMLCAALAACAHSTIQMIADVLGVALTSLEVEVTGQVDVRGSMLVGRGVPVGFQSMHCVARVTAAPETRRDRLDLLVRQSEHSCINLVTLRSGLAVTTDLSAQAQSGEPRMTQAAG